MICLGLGESVGTDRPRVEVGLDLDALLVDDAIEDSTSASRALVENRPLILSQNGL